jgi:uncharacterized protein involved in tolerance to divalent cations
MGIIMSLSSFFQSLYIKTYFDALFDFVRIAFYPFTGCVVMPLSSGLNPDRAFTIPAVYHDHSVQKPSGNNNRQLPKNWLADLVTVLKETAVDPTLHQYLDQITSRHCSAYNYYKCRHTLNKALQTIYLKIKDTSSLRLHDDQKTIIAMKLAEGAKECTPGFHDRVEETIQGFYQDYSLDGLLYNIRRDLVQQAAFVLNRFNEVHAQNRVFCVANEIGYGVLPFNGEDEYCGMLNDEIIARGLDALFKIRYTAYCIPGSVLNELKELLSCHGYQGSKSVSDDDQDVYLNKYYDKWLEILTEALALPPQNLPDTPYLIIDEKTSLVVDVNWIEISRELMRRFAKDHYFAAHEAQIMCDWVDSDPVVAKRGAQEIHQALKINKVTDLYQYLDIVPSIAAGRLLCQVHLATLTATELAELYCTTPVPMMREEVCSLFRQLHMGHPENIIDLSKPQFLLYLACTEGKARDQAIELLIQKKAPLVTHVFFKFPNLFAEYVLLVLMPLPMEQRMALFHCIDENQDAATIKLTMLEQALFANNETLLQHYLLLLESLDTQDLLGLFQQVVHMKYPVLLRAAYDRPKAIPHLASFLIKQFDRLGAINIFKLLDDSTENGNHSLLLVAHSHPEVLPNLLRLIDKLEAQQILYLFNKKNKEQKTLLMYSFLYMPKAIPHLLSLLNKVQVQGGDVVTTLKQEDQHKNSLLLLVLFAHPEDILPSILSFMSQLKAADILDLLLQPNIQGNNALLYAFYKVPKAIPHVLGFIQQMADTKVFTPKEVISLFRSRNQNGDNVLKLAAKHHPEQLPNLFKLLYQVGFQDIIDVFTQQELMSLLKASDQEGNSLLLLTSQQHPGQLPGLLKRLQVMNLDYIASLLAQQNKAKETAWIAACIRSPKATAHWITFFKNAMALSDKRTIQAMLTLLQQPDGKGNHPLLILTLLQPNQGLLDMLQLINQLPGPEALLLLKQANANGFNALMYAFYNAPKAVPHFIKLLTDLLNQEILTNADVVELLACQSSSKKTALQFAQERQPLALPFLNDLIQRVTMDKSLIGTGDVKIFSERSNLSSG